MRVEQDCRRGAYIYSSYIPASMKWGCMVYGLPDISEQERSVVRHAYDRFRMCACYLELVILFHYGVKINQKRMHRFHKKGRVGVERASQEERVSGFGMDNSNSL